MAKGLVLGILSALVLMVVGAYLFVVTGALPAGQDAAPCRLEKWAAKKSLRATVRREAKALANPLQPDDATLNAGLAIYRSHCQVCHGGPDAAASPIASGLSPTAPQLAKHGVEDDPEGVIFWKTAHGIRFTGMPGFVKSLGERDVWKVTLFLKHMNALPPAPKQAWRDAPTGG